MNPSAPATVDPVLLMVAVTRRLFALAAAAPLWDSARRLLRM